MGYRNGGSILRHLRPQTPSFHRSNFPLFQLCCGFRPRNDAAFALPCVYITMPNWRRATPVCLLSHYCQIMPLVRGVGRSTFGQKRPFPHRGAITELATATAAAFRLCNRESAFRFHFPPALNDHLSRSQDRVPALKRHLPFSTVTFPKEGLSVAHFAGNSNVAPFS